MVSTYFLTIRFVCINLKNPFSFVFSFSEDFQTSKRKIFLHAKHFIILESIIKSCLSMFPLTLPENISCELEILIKKTDSDWILLICPTNEERKKKHSWNQCITCLRSNPKSQKFPSTPTMVGD